MYCKIIIFPECQLIFKCITLSSYNTILNSNNNIIFFDGICALCNKFVQFVIRHDPEGCFKFAALQSDIAKRLLGESFTTPMKTVVLFQSGKIYKRSTAALRICAQLSGGWQLLYIFHFIPGFIRDAVYDIIAKSRYRWFGRINQCTVPPPEIRSRFLN